MDSYLLNMATLFIFAFIPPIVLKSLIKSYVVWRFLLGPSGLAGLMVGYYLVFQVRIYG